MNVVAKLARLSCAWVKYFYAFTKAGGGVKDSKIWVFGEWGGYIRGDNSAFLANYVADKDANINVYYVCRKNNGLNTNMLSDRIKILDYGSKQAEDILKKAGAIFISVSFYDVSTCPYNFYGKAISVHLRHDSPFKAGNERNFFYELYRRLVAHVINPRYSLSISEDFAKLKIEGDRTNPHRIIRAGFPRDSLLYSEKYLNEAKQKLLKKIHAEDNINIKIIAYMPTWRYNGDEIPDLQKIFSHDFITWLEENNVVIIHKAHFVTAMSNLENGKLIEASQLSKNIIAINDISATDLLAASDMLITDYSSCVWDFLILDRPVIHYAYDYEIFMTTSGLIDDFEKINCGPIVYDVAKLEKAIIDGINFPDAQKDLRAQRRERFLTYESPDSCERIYEFIVDELKE